MIAEATIVDAEAASVAVVEAIVEARLVVVAVVVPAIVISIMAQVLMQISVLIAGHRIMMGVVMHLLANLPVVLQSVMHVAM